jgi:hypothetical protein
MMKRLKALVERGPQNNLSGHWHGIEPRLRSRELEGVFESV